MVLYVSVVIHRPNLPKRSWVGAFEWREHFSYILKVVPNKLLLSTTCKSDAWPTLRIYIQNYHKKSGEYTQAASIVTNAHL
ncbi:hypothetical protein QL285_072700 [Trifolium repens]|nr:hypothetical protein QL285_072700 [Trifolium repens]